MSEQEEHGCALDLATIHYQHLKIAALEAEITALHARHEMREQEWMHGLAEVERIMQPTASLESKLEPSSSGATK